MRVVIRGTLPVRGFLRPRRAVLLAGLGITVLACLVGLVLLRRGGVDSPLWEPDLDSRLPAGDLRGGFPSSSRTQYRIAYAYSVVPGGVESAEELRAAIDRDPVVADHFRDFQISRASVTAAPFARLAHVSYRVNNRVYWTRKKVLLRAGERLISDGKNYVRARCGNRIADVPGTIAQAGEPAEEILNSPELPLLPLDPPPPGVILAAPPPVVSEANLPAGFIAPVPAIVPAVGGRIWPFILPALFPPVLFVLPDNPPPPPVPVPDPGPLPPAPPVIPGPTDTPTPPPVTPQDPSTPDPPVTPPPSDPPSPPPVSPLIPPVVPPPNPAPPSGPTPAPPSPSPNPIIPPPPPNPAVNPPPYLPPNGPPVTPRPSDPPYPDPLEPGPNDLLPPPVSVVPEPSFYGIIGAGLLGLLWAARRKRK